MLGTKLMRGRFRKLVGLSLVWMSLSLPVIERRDADHHR